MYIILVVIMMVAGASTLFSLAVRQQELTAKKEVQDRLRNLGKPRTDQKKLDKKPLENLIHSYQNMVNKHLPSEYGVWIEALMDKANLSMSITEIVALHLLGWTVFFFVGFSIVSVNNPALNAMFPLAMLMLFFMVRKIFKDKMLLMVILIIMYLIFYVFMKSFDNAIFGTPLFLTAIAGSFPGIFMPIIYLNIRISNRTAKFNDLLVDASTLLSNILKAGFALRQAIQVLAEDMPSPMSEEFSKVVQEVSYGLTLEEALTNLNTRIVSQDLDILVTAIMIQLDTGGNLAEILDKIASTIRDRIRMKREINALTAMGRMSGYVVAMMPFGVITFIYLVNPTYISVLWNTLPGQIALGGAIAMDGIGFLIINSMLKVDY